MVEFINRRHMTLTVVFFVAFAFMVALRGQGMNFVAAALGATAVASFGGACVALRDNQTPKRPKTAQKAAEASESARLAADCDYQHAAWQRGDWETAMYGRYQVGDHVPVVEEVMDAMVATITGSKPPPDRSWIEFGYRMAR